MSTAADAARERLQGDELIARFVRKFGDKVEVRPKSVLDFLGEQRVLALGMLNGHFRLAGPEGGDAKFRAVPEVLGVEVLGAPPFLWSPEMRMLAVQYELPQHVVGPSAFPHRSMWWTFHGSLPVQGLAGTHGDALLIVRMEPIPNVAMPPGWAIHTIGSDDDGGFISTGFIPDGTDSTSLDRDVRALLCMAAFLNSHVVSVDKRRAADENTKWRGRRIGDPSSLNVVTLRSEVREAVAVERGEGPQWKQRWLVRGHLRAQWYPSTKSHQVIWIAPYLKGPEDAPLKLPVYAVTR
jgi:hypothetical protein